MFHGRFVTATRVVLCMSNLVKLENMKNELNNAYTYFMERFMR